MTSREQCDDTSQRPERGTITAAAGRCVRRYYICRDYVTCLDARNATNRALVVYNELMTTEHISKVRYSYSYSSPLMMTPASSLTVAVFHRRVGRYRIPMACYLARRAVRRRTSSTNARQQPAVSVGAPCRPRRTGQPYNSSRRRDPPSSLPAIVAKD